MTATAQTLVTRVLRRLQAINITEQPSAAEVTHGLDLLEEVIDGFGANGITAHTFVLTGDLVADQDTVKNITPDLVMIGHNVTGTGIPIGARVKAVLSSTRIQLTEAATVSGSAVSLSFVLLPTPAAYEGALVAMLAVRMSEDLGIPVSAKLAMDSAAGWASILAGYVPDRKAQFDRAMAMPAGIWDASTGLLT